MFVTEINYQDFTSITFPHWGDTKLHMHIVNKFHFSNIHSKINIILVTDLGRDGQDQQNYYAAGPVPQRERRRSQLLAFFGC